MKRQKLLVATQADPFGIGLWDTVVTVISMVNAWLHVVH